MTESYTEGNYAGEFIIMEEDDGCYSKDAGTLKSGNNLLAGAVLGKLVTAATATATAAATNVGNGSIGTVTAGANAMAGIYLLRIIKAAANGGDFEVTDPQGDVVGLGTVAVAFAAGGLSFTLADGSTDFAVGDNIAIVVTAVTEKWTELAPTATDGSQIAAAVLFADVDATSADAACVVVVRLALVDTAKLVWPAGITAAQKATALAQLKAAGIVPR